MPDCSPFNIAERVCGLEDAVQELLTNVGHAPAVLTFSAGPNSWNTGTQVGNINVPVIPSIPDPEVVVTTDATARGLLTPQKLNQLLVQTTDPTNSNNSIWVATGLTAGAWGLKVGSLGSQNAGAVAITGGNISGITDLAVADGGTGASTAANARINLALATLAPAANVIDWALGEDFFELLGANTIYTFSNAADGLEINVAVAGGTGYTVTFPVAVKWPGGSAPTHSGAGKTDLFSFKQIGGVIYGVVAANYTT